MSIQPIKCLLVASLLFACNSAQAIVVNFQFSGTVNAGNMALLGDSVTGTFSYDTASTPSFSMDLSSGTITNYLIYRPNALNVSFGSHIITSDSLSIEIINNLNSNTPDHFSLGTISMQLDGVELPESYFSLTLGTYPLDPTAYSAIKSSKLPSNLNVNDFFYNDGSYGSDRTGNPLYSVGFEIESITSDAPPVPTPLPSSAILFVSAILGFFGLQRKTKAA